MMKILIQQKKNIAFLKYDAFTLSLFSNLTLTPSSNSSSKDFLYMSSYGVSTDEAVSLAEKMKKERERELTEERIKEIEEELERKDLKEEERKSLEETTFSLRNHSNYCYLRIICWSNCYGPSKWLKIIKMMKILIQQKKKT